MSDSEFDSDFVRAVTDFVRALTEELRGWQDETQYLTPEDVAAMLARASARALGLEHAPPNEEDSNV